MKLGAFISFPNKVCFFLSFFALSKSFFKLDAVFPFAFTPLPYQKLSF